MDIGEVAIMFMGNHFHVIQKITDEQIRTVDTYGDRKEKVIQWKPVEVEDIDMRSIFDWAA